MADTLVFLVMASKLRTPIFSLAAFCLPAFASAPRADSQLNEKPRLGVARFALDARRGAAAAKPSIAPGIAGYLCDEGRRSHSTGQVRDERTGLDYFGARYFSAAMGRFTSVDPGNAGASPENPQSWNMYGYAVNNPLRFTDPLGLAPEDGKCGQQVGSQSCYKDGAAGEARIYAPELPSGDRGPLDRPANVAIGWIKQNISDHLDLMGGDNPTKTIKDIQWALQPSNKRQQAGANASMLFGIVGVVGTIGSLDDLAKIVTKHSFQKHVLKQGEYPGWIRTEKQFAEHVKAVLSDPNTESRNLTSGRQAFWHNESGTVLIVNGAKPSQSTMFQPRDGKKFFDGLR